jgi:dihydroorotase
MTGLRLEHVVDPLRGAEPVDIEINDGVIVAIDPSFAPAAARDRLVLPSLVDIHTHLREPGGEDAETIATGCQAAAAGGYGDVFAMANTDPVTDTVEKVRHVRALAAHAAVRVHVVSAATMGLAGREPVVVEELTAAGVTLFSDDGRCVDDEALLRDLLQRLAGTGARFAEHCQSGPLAGSGVVNDRIAKRAGAAGWPAAGEEVIVERDIRLAAETGTPVHLCHLSTRGSVDLVREAKHAGVPITAEVTPHHLVLTDLDALSRGPSLKVNPPLRSQEDVIALREALLDGTIDAVGTDHAPHPARRKTGTWASAAFGLTGLETALSIVARSLAEQAGSGVPWTRLVEAMVHAPARIGGLPQPRGLTVGAPADLCVVRTDDPWTVRAETQRSRSRNTPFDGEVVRERVAMTILGGRLAYAAPAA